jgi:hypothetical protein
VVLDQHVRELWAVEHVRLRRGQSRVMGGLYPALFRDGQVKLRSDSGLDLVACLANWLSPDPPMSAGG